HHAGRLVGGDQARRATRRGVTRRPRSAKLGNRISMRASGALLAALFASSLSGQTNGASQPSFRAESNLVVIPVSVTDSVNRFVLGLRKEDFKLLDNGVEQPISHFSGEDVPLSIGLAFDISGSMDFKLRAARDAAATMLKTMGPDDEAFLAEFNDKVDL